MAYQCFDLNVKDHIAHISMNRPEKRNSMIPKFWAELPELVRKIETEHRARVIVISSTGPHFTSGMDVSVFDSSETIQSDLNPEKTARLRGLRFYDNVRYLQETFSCLERCRIPVLAAVQGGAIGAGVDLITACDMRYMTADAFLTIFEINIGMTADVGTFPRITHLLPEGIVKELAYTGRRMGAEEAKARGFINDIFPTQDALLESVMAIAKQIASKAPLAIYGSKRMINYARDHSTEDALDYVRIWNASMLQQEEIHESMRAAKEQRAGEYVDLPSPYKKMTNSIDE
ncbi:MAG: enoyl-CoA hydratase [Gammaproteobacteria bacterium]|nr:enoyl-CoA hydratase [Gammaproteobacteria bacterium]|tara:strand:- start:2319 stop:3185 length:867 start_codon:yes stop_codon:yes gene_type:complete